MFWLWLSCDADPEETAPISDTDDLDEGEPYAPLFAFAAIADPHIYATSGDHNDRLTKALDWIDAEAAGRGIELVLVLGDVGWGEGLQTSREPLDTLSVPYVPVIGDNEPHAGDDENFDSVFADARDTLASTYADYVEAAIPVWDEELQAELWLQNYAFTHPSGLRFLVLDWASRDPDIVAGEMGDLHEIDGGTWGFFTEQVTSWQGLDESLVMATHNPMILVPGGFYEDEDARVTAVTGEHATKVAMNLAGHLHGDHSETREAGYDLTVLDATWDDEISLLVVDVAGNDEGFLFTQELVVVE